MSETRKVDSTLEPIILAVTISTLVELTAQMIGEVRLILFRSRFLPRRTLDDEPTIDAEIPVESVGVPGWTMADNVVTLTYYPVESEVAIGFYESEVWVYDTEGRVLKAPSGRRTMHDIREALTLTGES